MPLHEASPLPAPLTEQSYQSPGAVAIPRGSSAASSACQQLTRRCLARSSTLAASLAWLVPPIIALIVVGATIAALVFTTSIQPLAVGAFVVGAILMAWLHWLFFFLRSLPANTLWPLPRNEWLTPRLDGITVSDATVLLRKRKCADVYRMLNSQAVRILRSPPESGKTSLVSLLLFNRPFWRLSFRVDLSGWHAQTASLEDYWLERTGESLVSSLDPYSGRFRT